MSDSVNIYQDGSVQVGLAQIDEELRTAVAAQPAVKAATFISVPAVDDTPARTMLQVESVHPNAGLLQTIQVFNQQNVDILSVETLDPNLETVFLRLTGKSLRN